MAALSLALVFGLTGCGQLAGEIENNAPEAATAIPQPLPSETTKAKPSGTASPVAPTAPESSAPTSAASAAPATAPPASAAPATAPPSSPPTPSASPSSSGEITLTEAQSSMAPAVQQACGWLLTPGTEGPMPAAEAAGCVAEAMKAGGGALQTMETNASGLPAGSHTAEIRTSPGFALHFKNEEHRVEIVVVDGSSWLITPDGEVKADSAGSPEEKYAALLVEAAGLVSDPAAVSALITDSGDFRVEHGAERNGIAYTKISALSGPTVQGVKMGSFDIWLDDLYRPVHVELAGNENEILTTISATFEDWGRDTVILPPA